MTSPKTIARVAGALYLAMAVLGAVGEQVRSSVIVTGNAATTADNLGGSVVLFRAGFVSNLLSNVFFLLTAMALYVLLSHVHRFAAAAMVTFVAVAVAIGYLNVLNDYTAMTIATDPHYAAAFGQAGSQELVRLFAGVQTSGGAIDEIFWGLWLLPLGYLVMRSAYFPRAVGVLLVIAGLSWTAQFFLGILAPEFGQTEAFLGLGAIGEFIFIGWLLVMSVRVPASDASLPATDQPPTGRPPSAGMAR